MTKTTTKWTSERSAARALENLFIDAIDAYLLANRPSDRQRLLDLCEQILDSSMRVPMALRLTMEEAIGNWIETQEWTQRGATYGGAARRIRWRLLDLNEATPTLEYSNAAA